MQERQDFIDHTALFGEHDYEPPKDYTRTRGLLEDVRQAMIHVSDMRAIAASMAPVPPKTHEASAPLDLPSPPSSQSAAQIATPQAAPPRNTSAGAGTPAPARAIVDRVER